MSEDWTVTPRLLNHFSIGGNTFFKNSYSPNSGKNWKDKVCIKNAVDCNANFPNISFSDETGWGSTTYNGTEQPNWSIKEDLSWIRGAHIMKFGYAFTSQRANGFGQQNISGPGELQLPRNRRSRRDHCHQRQCLRVVPVGQCRQRRDRDHSLRPADVSAITAFTPRTIGASRKRLTVNFGLRYEFTLPPVAGDDQYEDFSPTTPNPAVNNYPGALIFAGTGPGRQGVRSLVPGWYGAIGPARRPGLFAQSEDHHPRRLRPLLQPRYRRGQQQPLRRLHRAVQLRLQQSGHHAGLQLGPGLAVVPAAAADRPVVLQQSATPTTGRARTPPARRNPTTGPSPSSAQSLATPRFEVELQRHRRRAPAGGHGEHQSGADVRRQQPDRRGSGPTRPSACCNSNITSAAAVAAGIKPPYPNFTNSAVQRSQTVNQALRPFPQYLTIDTSQSGGDKSGHSTYNALVLKLDHRFGRGPDPAVELCALQTADRLRHLLRQQRLRRGQRQSPPGKIDRPVRPDARAEVQHHLPTARSARASRWMNRGLLSQVIGGWRLGARSRSTQRTCRSRVHAQQSAADLQWRRPADRHHLRRLARCQWTATSIRRKIFT